MAILAFSILASSPEELAGCIFDACELRNILVHLSDHKIKECDANKYFRLLAITSVYTGEATGLTNLANSLEHPDWLRRRALLLLLHRNLHVGMRASDIGRLLDAPTWLNKNLKEQVIVVDFILGRPLVRRRRGETLFLINPNLADKDHYCVIYIRLGGKISREEFLQCLQDPKYKGGTLTVTAIACDVSEKEDKLLLKL